MCIFAGDGAGPSEPKKPCKKKAAAANGDKKKRAATKPATKEAEPTAKKQRVGKHGFKEWSDSDMELLESGQFEDSDSGSEVEMGTESGDDESVDGDDPLIGMYCRVPAAVFKVKGASKFHALIEGKNEKGLYILYFDDDKKRWPFEPQAVQKWLVPIKLFDPPSDDE